MAHKGNIVKPEQADDEFNEDFHYNVPLEELDFLELDENMENYEVHLKTGTVRKFRGTKAVSYNPPYLTIR